MYEHRLSRIHEFCGSVVKCKYAPDCVKPSVCLCSLISEKIMNNTCSHRLQINIEVR